MSESPGKPPADTSWLQTTQTEPPPATIHAAIARVIGRVDPFDVMAFSMMFVLLVVLPLVLIIWGAK